MFRRLITAAAVTVITLSPIASGRGLANSAVYKKTLPSVAWILTKEEDRMMQATAWVVDVENRLLVTNHHVVAKAEKMVVFFPEYEGGKLITDREWYAENGTPIPARTVLASQTKDLAVIQVKELPEGAKALKLAEGSPEAGDLVYTVGNPGTKPNLWAGAASTVRKVERLSRKFDDTPFDATAQESKLGIHKGASGSPVVNADGEVVGVIFGGDFRLDDNTLVKAYSVDVSEVRVVVGEARRPLVAGTTRRGGGHSEAEARRPRMSLLPAGE
jgi:S1-C subfamily serine protease